ncbi:MAG: hypothetical protein JXP34_25500 [Planctomycetes bacterium]|nr:hypothetical protein [Planctomycetota bacterium]
MMPAMLVVWAFCIDFNWGPGGINGFARPGLWADAEPEAHVAWYDGLGCNVIQTFAVSCNGYAWYKGGIVPPQPGLRHDFLPEVVRLGHARGLRVMGYFCVGANTRWGLEHPELSYGTPSAPHIPFTRAYLDFLASSIEDALRRTGMDGFMIDWVWNPGDTSGEPLRWLPCEREMYEELLAERFPGKEAVAPERELEFRRKAIDRCWERIRDAAKKVKPDAIIWLSSSHVDCPTVVDSRLFREVDWLMNEATDPAVLASLERMKGPHTRLLQCVVGWGDRHDARRIVAGEAGRGIGIYGFAKPGADSLPLPIETYRGRPIASFQGNDRNIAVLARAFRGKPLETVTPQEAGGRIVLLPETANAEGTSPVVMDGQIGHWGNPRDSVGWIVNVKAPGTFQIDIEYAVEKGFGGSTFEVRAGGETFEMVSVDTGSWRAYRTFPVGRVELRGTGKHTIALVPSAKTPWKAISLKAIRLSP